MKKITSIGFLVFFAFGCAKTSSLNGSLSPATKSTVASQATCSNAVKENVAESTLEQDPTVTDAIACQNRSAFSVKYQGKTCDFPETTIGTQTLPAQTGVKIAPITCDDATIASIGKERAPFLVKLSSSVSTTTSAAPNSAPAKTSPTKSDWD